LTTKTGPNGRPLRPAKSAAAITANTLTVTKNQALEISNLGISKLDELIKDGKLEVAPRESTGRVLIKYASLRKFLGC
jgi:hypothetical protein